MGDHKKNAMILFLMGWCIIYISVKCMVPIAGIFGAILAANGLYLGKMSG
jgi:hypothetical protein